MFNETLESSFFFYVFKFMFDKVQNKRVLLVILSHSATKIRYKNTVNFKVKNPICFWDMLGGEKKNVTILFWSILFSTTSVP